MVAERQSRKLLKHKYYKYSKLVCKVLDGRGAGLLGLLAAVLGLQALLGLGLGGGFFIILHYIIVYEIMVYYIML